MKFQMILMTRLGWGLKGILQVIGIVLLVDLYHGLAHERKTQKRLITETLRLILVYMDDAMIRFSSIIVTNMAIF